MLREIISSSIKGALILEWIEYAALAIEVLAVLIIVVAMFYSVIRYSYKGILQQKLDSRYKELKISLGKALLLDYLGLQKGIRWGVGSACVCISALMIQLGILYLRVHHILNAEQSEGGAVSASEE